MGRIVRVGVPTVVTVGLVGWALTALGPSSLWFAVVVVWLPMTWLGTVSRVLPPTLPEGWYRLRAVERDGRIHERLGVRVAKALLRRGPARLWNPGLRLPADPTPERLSILERRMRVAEATHVILFVGTLGVVLHAALRGWWAAAVVTLALDVLLNGYPALLQRYNRALLDRRFAGPPDGRT